MRRTKIILWSTILVSFLMAIPGCLLANEDKEKTQYERRLNMLAQRYQRAPTGTVEFPKELMAVEYINEGYKLFRESEYDMALSAAKEALKYDANSPVAHELAGDVYYLKQDLDKARDHHWKAFRLQPEERLKEKLEKLQRETAVEKSFSTVREEHFLIKFNGNQSDYEGFELKTMLRDTYLDLARELAHYLNHKTTVLFYDVKDFHSTGDVAHWVGGLYDGKVRLPVHPRAYGEKELQSVIRHELTHVLLDDLGKKNTPVWIHEGYAVYQQNKIQKIQASSLRKLRSQKHLIPMHTLFNNDFYETQKDNMEWVNRFYIQSYDVVDYIIGRYGVFYLKQMVLKFAENKNAEQVISEVLKISIAKLEKEWKASLASASL